MRSDGKSFQKIADELGLGKTTVLEAFNGRKPARVVPQAHPDRVTRMTAYNGGCSTVSGMVPVTLPRLRCLEAANDNVPSNVRVAA